ncbi:hypothetical protein [Streptosporangium sp. NPDC006007]|uniref:hypothetical protein n=1 Tax=Streptosporangium sp. NPDC006007 TaxID=3154575 RepID=UPI0033AF6784
MIPHPAGRLDIGPPPQVIVAMDDLRKALLAHDVHTSLRYEDRQPRLHAGALTVWADPCGQTFFWSTCHGERAEHGPADDLAD